MNETVFLSTTPVTEHVIGVSILPYVILGLILFVLPWVSYHLWVITHNMR